MKANQSESIYLDYNASTPLDARVAQAMVPYLSAGFGNPSSTHSFGREAKKAIETAREKVAALVGAQPDEIIFTSGGSESNNIALRGILEPALARGETHLITSAFEHPAVSAVCKYLETRGVSIDYLPVSAEGFVDPESLRETISAQTCLVSVMHANNEIGSVQDIAAISQIAREYGVPVHTDAAQSVGKISVNVDTLGVSLLSIAGHKLYGPKGVGALYVRRGTHLTGCMYGADHEQGLRPGTENVLEIVGLGVACEIAEKELEAEKQRLSALRDDFWQGLTTNFSDQQAGEWPLLRKNTPDLSLPNTLNVSVRGVAAESLLALLPELALSAGAACHADGKSASATLRAIALPSEYVNGTLRISLGKQTRKAEVERAIALLTTALKQVTGGILPRSNSAIALTQHSVGLGCGCKLRPQVLARLLSGLPAPTVRSERLIGDYSTFEDAAIFDTGNGMVLVQSVDFFTPIVDDPYDFGAVAAANALSDIYAMGAKPTFALSIVCFPSDRLPEDVCSEILRGSSDKCAEAGIAIAGGHSVDDAELKYGLVVNGIVAKDMLWLNSGACAGDSLLLTKPVGTGILATALKRGDLTETARSELTENLLKLNATAAAILSDFTVHACTDVTGFGLLGHLGEMCKASQVSATVNSQAVPHFAQVERLIRQGCVPGGSQNNKEYSDSFVEFDSTVPAWRRLLLNDAQTSGGLLVAIERSETDRALAALESQGLLARCIGAIESGTAGVVRVR